MTLYKIANWSSIYETHETRKLVRLTWIPMPNKHDGLGFRLIAAEKDGAELFAAWVLLVQIASKSDRSSRGSLWRDQTPLDATGMALMTGFPKRIFERALAFFSQPRIGWLVAEQCQTDLPLSPGIPGESPALPGESPGRMEWNGMEGKGNKKGPASPDVLPFSSEDFRSAWTLFERHRREIKKPLTPTAAKLSLEMLGRIGEPRAIRCIKHTIEKGWQGLREPEGAGTVAYQAERQAMKEPTNWKATLNHEYPESAYSTGGIHEAHTWDALPRHVQETIWGAIKKAS
jgi:hypothetical protein